MSPRTVRIIAVVLAAALVLLVGAELLSLLLS